MKRGIFTISLDFELYWGVHDVMSSQQYKDNLLNAKKAALSLLSVFEEKGIGTTWAVVDALRLASKEEFKKKVGDYQLPYANKVLSPLPFEEKLGNESIDIIFAPEVIEQIRKSKRQEIATHTFSHCYVLEDGFSIESFEKEFEQMRESIEDDEVETIIFPRNQFNKEFLSSCYKKGLRIYRGNPKYRAYKPKSLSQDYFWFKLFRLINSYFGPSSRYLHELVYDENKLFNVPASLFLRPFRTRSIFQNLKIARIKSLMTAAAKQKKLFHLWWHPHNFGERTSENLAELNEILNHYKTLEKEYGFLNLNMSEIRKEMKKK